MKRNQHHAHTLHTRTTSPVPPFLIVHCFACAVSSLPDCQCLINKKPVHRARCQRRWVGPPAHHTAALFEADATLPWTFSSNAISASSTAAIQSPNNVIFTGRREISALICLNESLSQASRFVKAESSDHCMGNQDTTSETFSTDLAQFRAIESEWGRRMSRACAYVLMVISNMQGGAISVIISCLLTRESAQQQQHLFTRDSSDVVDFYGVLLISRQAGVHLRDFYLHHGGCVWRQNFHLCCHKVVCVEESDLIDMDIWIGTQINADVDVKM